MICLEVGVDDTDARKRLTAERLGKFFGVDDFEAQQQVHGVSAAVARASLEKVGLKADLVHIFSMAREDHGTQVHRAILKAIVSSFKLRERKARHHPTTPHHPHTPTHPPPTPPAPPQRSCAPPDLYTRPLAPSRRRRASCRSASACWCRRGRSSR